MAVSIVFETHATTEDNEAGIATGWLPGRLSDLGRGQAAELGERRGNDGIDVVFSSDLRRAVETVEIAFATTSIPVLLDWRLRECDYGVLNGAARERVVGERSAHLETAYPGGESWREAVERVAAFVGDLPSRWSGARILVVGHVATHVGLAHALAGASLEELLAADFDWRPGWEFEVG